MATSAELKALSNAQLASGTEIPATKHRTVNDAIIDELFLAQSRGDVLAAVQSALAIAAGDKVLVIRGGQAFLLDADEFGFIDTFVGLSDVNIPSPSNNQIVAYDFATSKFIAKDLANVDGSITGIGTVNKIVKFTAGSVIGNSIITDSGTTVTISGGLTVSGVLNLLGNSWVLSSEGNQRFFFSSNSHTYLKSRENIYFRTNNTDADTTYVSAGVYYGNGLITTGSATASSFIGDGRTLTNTLIALVTNATAHNLLSRSKARFTATYTASTTLTFSNATLLEEFTMQLTNTNANTITFAGITLYFKTFDLPLGISFAANALTFPADSAVKYNIVGVRFDGSTFDCKIEVR
jgi:hypothetical protein